MKIKAFLVFVLCAAMPCTSYATNAIRVTGYTSTDATGATLMILKNQKNLSNFTSSDIAYINQYHIDQNGAFSVYLPLEFDNGYSLYSNTTLSDPEHVTISDTLYVSSTGSDSGDGTEISPYKTISHAVSINAENNNIFNKIVLLDDADYDIGDTSYRGTITIQGADSTVKLNLPSEIKLAGNLDIENVTLSGSSVIYAAGKSLVIGRNVKSDSRNVVYGGTKNKDINANTNITLLGGMYSAVYGGCNGGTLNGHTSVTIGGNVNPNDGINDDASNISPCYVYGGGNNGAVTGSTHVSLNDNATVKYLVGAGTGSKGTATQTGIDINGGQVMNVYGGSTNALLSNCTTEINMNGGLAEALFGGSESQPLTGHTYINLNGGEVLRRVYTGCYNNWSLGWDSDRYVTGTTVLTISPGVLLNNASGQLSSGNSLNRGVFCGSRTAAAHAQEQNTVIYLDDCYNTYINQMGDKSGWGSTFKSYPNYIVKACEGGKVTGTDVAGMVFALPDESKAAKSNNQLYVNENVPVAASATTTVEFVDRYGLDIANQVASYTSVTGKANYTSADSAVTSNIYIAVYAPSGQLLCCLHSGELQKAGSFDFNLPCALESGKTYAIKAFLWDAGQKPLYSQYAISISK